MDAAGPPPSPEFPHALVAALQARRGRVHLTERLDPLRTALVVIDMQRAFTEPQAPSETQAAKSIIPNINRLAAAVRSGGGLVAFSQATFSQADDGGWPAYYSRMVNPETAARILAQLRPGAPLHALDPELEVKPGDFVFPKSRYSAFARGASALEPQLRDRDIGTVIVAGTITNVCCESTARDAMQLGFDSIMVADANAARDVFAHQATLETFIQFFGDVLTTAQVLHFLKLGARAPMARPAGAAMPVVPMPSLVPDTDAEPLPVAALAG